VNTGDVAQLTADALMLTLLLSLPPILVATFVGLIVSLLQAITQIQEQTLSFAVKLICVAVVILMTAAWVSSEMFTYTQRILSGVARI
jgi:type III secretion protein S